MPSEIQYANLNRSPAGFPQPLRANSFFADAPLRSRETGRRRCKACCDSDKFKRYAKRFLSNFLPDDLLVFIVRQTGRNFEPRGFDRKRKLRLSGLRTAAGEKGRRRRAAPA